MATSSTERSFLCFMTFVTLAWLCTCAVSPYWKTIQLIDKIDLGIIGKAFPMIQGIFDKAHGIFSAFSINVGIIYSCVKDQFCVENSEIQPLAPLFKVPEEKHIILLSFGLSLLVIGFM
ncbi:unnamed protein product [Adineta steineri]|uniref:Uncharacterized protein n=1 Tax=Adineta steineri TaxID=433720 RepID=A0A819KHP0_9BILA|nr:unnamed protein product [Adineta steineri]